MKLNSNDKVLVSQKERGKKEGGEKDRDRKREMGGLIVRSPKTKEEDTDSCEPCVGSGNLTQIPWKSNQCSSQWASHLSSPSF